MLALAIALAPTLAILLFLFYREQFHREPAGVLAGSFLFGVAATLPAIALESLIGYFHLEETIHGTVLFVFFGIAAVEELTKFLPLRFYSFTRRSFDEPMDGIVHAVMVGLGFATLENVLYVTANGIEVGFLRMFLSVPGHAAYGVLMGYFFGKAKFNYQRRVPLLLSGFVVATFFHGLYDSCLFVSTKVADQTTKAVLIMSALTVDVVIYVFAVRLLQQYRSISRTMFQHHPVCTIRNATPDDVPLIKTLANQIWPVAYDKILSRQQVYYMMQLFYSDSALRRQMSEGHQFIIVYNTAVPVGFASFSEVEPTVFKLQKIYLLPNQQGRGTGKFTIDQVIAAVVPRGASALRLNVNRRNNARGFYERLGFTVIAEEKIDIGSGYFMDDFVMEKRLQDAARVGENALSST